MAGLDKILEEIRKENELEIQNIISKAEAKAKRIIEEKQKELDERNQYMDKKMEKVIKLDLDKGVSSAISFKKKIVLEEKQRLIKEVIESSKEYIKNLPKEEYIEFFEKVALSHAHSESGRLKLNKSDSERFGKELLDRINAKLSSNSKGTLVLDDEFTTEKSGFVIVYGDVEENCSLEAIFSEKSELIADKMNSFLFA